MDEDHSEKYTGHDSTTYKDEVHHSASESNHLVGDKAEEQLAAHKTKVNMIKDIHEKLNEHIDKVIETIKE